MVVSYSYINKVSKSCSMLEMLYQEPVPFPVMATLAVILAVMRFSVHSAVETTKPQLGGSRWALLLITTLLLVIAVHCFSSSSTSMNLNAYNSSVDRGTHLSRHDPPMSSWVLLFLNVFLLYMALNQRTFRRTLFHY